MILLNFLKKNNKFLGLFLISLILLVVAQPDLSSYACIVSSVLGFALLWKANSFLKRKRAQLVSSFVWFSFISFAHLNWFTADRYVGWYIYIFLVLLVSLLAGFFALLSLWISYFKKITISEALFISSLWTLFEWSRLFFLSGFSWDPLGIMMTAHIYPLQLASLCGILGLSFWVLFTNIIAYRSLGSWNKKNICLLLCLITFPFGFGFLSMSYHSPNIEKSPKLSALLVQTSLYPEEKVAYLGFENKTIPLYEQWKRIFQLVHKHKDKDLDLIVLSEAAVPYGTFYPLYKQSEATLFFREHFPYSIPHLREEDYVGNAFFAQSLAQATGADVIIGFEDGDFSQSRTVYNAAFLFHPHSSIADRYEKRVLVPMGEYIPFSFCKQFLSHYGITDSFTPGREAKVFKGKKIPLGFSICYEETYGHLMRQNRQKGAHMLVNLTNDVWYPHSRLPIVHFYHGRVRAVEGGYPIVRACNTGVTCALDSLGRVVDMLPYEKKGCDSPASSLLVSVPLYAYKTFYTDWGDSAIIGFSISCVLVYFVQRFRRSPLLLVKRIFRN